MTPASGNGASGGVSGGVRSGGRPGVGRSAEMRGRVEAVIRGLRPGEVVSYGDVADQAGYPGAARAVGTILARSDGLPWWRVVTASGRLVPGLEAEHARRLRAEGVELAGGRVRIRRLRWREPRKAGRQRCS